MARLMDPRREPLTSASGDEAAQLEEGLLLVASGARIPDAPFWDYPMLPCRRCRIRLTDLKLSRGPLLVIGPRLAEALAGFVAPNRAAMTAAPEREVIGLVARLMVAVHSVFVAMEADEGRDDDNE